MEKKFHFFIPVMDEGGQLGIVHWAGSFEMVRKLIILKREGIPGSFPGDTLVRVLDPETMGAEDYILCSLVE